MHKEIFADLVKFAAIAARAPKITPEPAKTIEKKAQGWSGMGMGGYGGYSPYGAGGMGMGGMPYIRSWGRGGGQSRPHPAFMQNWLRLQQQDMPNMGIGPAWLRGYSQQAEQALPEQYENEQRKLMSGQQSKMFDQATSDIPRYEQQHREALGQLRDLETSSTRAQEQAKSLRSQALGGWGSEAALANMGDPEAASRSNFLLRGAAGLFGWGGDQARAAMNAKAEAETARKSYDSQRGGLTDVSNQARSALEASRQQRQTLGKGLSDTEQTIRGGSLGHLGQRENTYRSAIGQTIQPPGVPRPTPEKIGPQAPMPIGPSPAITTPKPNKFTPAVPSTFGKVSSLTDRLVEGAARNMFEGYAKIAMAKLVVMSKNAALAEKLKAGVEEAKLKNPEGRLIKKADYGLAQRIATKTITLERRALKGLGLWPIQTGHKNKQKSDENEDNIKKADTSSGLPTSHETSIGPGRAMAKISRFISWK